MTIAISANTLTGSGAINRILFFSEIFRAIADQHPEHRFYVLSGNPAIMDFFSSGNMEFIHTELSGGNALLSKYRLDIKLPRLLKKINATVYLGTDPFISMNTSVPQCLLWPPADIKTRYLKKAKMIAAISSATKNILGRRHEIPESNIAVLDVAAGENFKPVTRDEKEEIKKQFSDGKDFFLCQADFRETETFTCLLKAFSGFKKRQQSNMKLLIAGVHNPVIINLAATYKYREDLKLLNLHETEISRVTAAAYTCIFPGSSDDILLPALQAMQCGVPVIAKAERSMQEMAGEAVMYTDEGDSKILAGKMMLVYTDENLKYSLGEKGKIIARGFTVQKSVNQLWQCIVKASA